jgi:hypothetical protein
MTDIDRPGIGLACTTIEARETAILKNDTSFGQTPDDNNSDNLR